jgi:hypothetical protein
MLSGIEALRVMALNYRQAAEHQTDPDERKRFLSYAKVYDELATQHEQRAIDEGKEAPER